MNLGSGMRWEREQLVDGREMGGWGTAAVKGGSNGHPQGRGQHRCSGRVDLMSPLCWGQPMIAPTYRGDGEEVGWKVGTAEWRWRRPPAVAVPCGQRGRSHSWRL